MVKINGQNISRERMVFEENGFRAVDKGNRVVLYRAGASVITALYTPGSMPTFLVALARLKGYVEGWTACDVKTTDARDVVSMLLLCGELGGPQKDETMAAYLRRILDDNASKKTCTCGAFNGS